MGPDVGLRGSIGHRVIANPGCQVDVESIWVNDSIRIHQTLFGQLQNEKKKLEAFQMRAAFGALATKPLTNGLETQHIEDRKSRRV